MENKKGAYLSAGALEESRRRKFHGK